MSTSQINDLIQSLQAKAIAEQTPDVAAQNLVNEAVAMLQAHLSEMEAARAALESQEPHPEVDARLGEIEVADAILTSNLARVLEVDADAVAKAMSTLNDALAGLQRKKASDILRYTAAHESHCRQAMNAAAQALFDSQE